MNNDIHNNDFHDDSIQQLEDHSYDEYSEVTGIAVPLGDSTEPLDPSIPVYQLRLPYSHETFHAVFTMDPLAVGTMVIVPTRYGKDIAQIIGLMQNRGTLTIGEVVHIDRIASAEDLEKTSENNRKKKEAFEICRQKIAAHHLDMKLVSVHYLLEESKILFFFTAESRVDFRELVKDLVGIFKTRIELRQIGVRDESRIVGGLGVCGRGYCCHSVSDKLKPVSIKMAKDQNLSLNSMKISGPCGRLLCCLAYEHTFYNEARRQMPPEGCKLTYQDSNWKVIEVDPVGGKIKIICEDGRQVYMPTGRFEKQEGRWRIIDL